jgi:hypothetical protein
VILLRLAGLAFAAIEIALALRLLLPFVEEVPPALSIYVPDLIEVTDTLMQPFERFVQPFDLGEAFGDLGQLAAEGLADYADALDPAVIVAMVGWAIISTFVLFLMRLIIRPGG